ncbi:hypothetical protein Hanom_Chr17g01551481 [Helianthus anomalus]
MGQFGYRSVNSGFFTPGIEMNRHLSIRFLIHVTYLLIYIQVHCSIKLTHKIDVNL